jgi:hypothetical protein
LPASRRTRTPDSPILRRNGGAQAALLTGARQETEKKMARKPATRAEFTLFDVVYEDGSQRSNRRVPSELLGGLDGDAPARTFIEDQDRIIAEKSGVPPSAVKTIRRSGEKDKGDKRTGSRSSRYAPAAD